MLEFLRRWFGRSSATVRTRLSREEALAIARHAAAHDSLAPQLALTTIELRAGLPVWIVSSASVGQVLEVSIDDSTGHAFQVQRLGLR
jgi:hypothetical protein